MRILMTGGTGFIGSLLCHHLGSKGARLVVLSRRPECVRDRCGLGVTAIRSFAQLDSSDTFDAVINLAGEPIIGPRWTDARKKILWDSRVTLTQSLVEYIGRAHKKPKVLVSGSAVGYYGDRGNEVLDETSAPPSDGFGHRLCAAWEAAAMQAVEEGVRVCIVRTGLVLGSTGGLLARLLLPFRLGLGGRIGSGTQWMSWVHAQDYVALVAHLLDASELSGVFNGTAPNPVTNREFTETLAGILRRPALLPMPAWLVRLTLGREMSALLLGGQRVIPKRLVDAGFRFQFPELESALRDVLAHIPGLLPES
jgi:uncharacterized protein (TIGR01777 family)